MSHANDCGYREVSDPKWPRGSFHAVVTLASYRRVNWTWRILGCTRSHGQLGGTLGVTWRRTVEIELCWHRKTTTDLVPSLYAVSVLRFSMSRRGISQGLSLAFAYVTWMLDTAGCSCWVTTPHAKNGGQLSAISTSVSNFPLKIAPYHLPNEKQCGEVSAQSKTVWRVTPGTNVQTKSHVGGHATLAHPTDNRNVRDYSCWQREDTAVCSKLSLLATTWNFLGLTDTAWPLSPFDRPTVYAVAG